MRAGKPMFAFEQKSELYAWRVLELRHGHDARGIVIRVVETQVCYTGRGEGLNEVAFDLVASCERPHIPRKDQKVSQPAIREEETRDRVDRGCMEGSGEGREPLGRNTVRIDRHEDRTDDDRKGEWTSLVS